MDKKLEIAACILDVFECFLADKGIYIPNRDRDMYVEEGGTEAAILFGEDYYSLEDQIIEILSRYGVN